MENQQQQPQNTPLCRANCGFYGSPATDDLCSKCFKDMIARKQETGNAQRHTQASAAGNKMDGISSASTSDEAEEQMNILNQLGEQANDNASAEKPSLVNDAPSTISSQPSLPVTPNKDEAPKKPTNRCHVCNKRVGLTGFECRCGGLYCGEHRYDTAHNCTFDYKTTGRDELRKNNPQVISEKIQRI